MARETLEDRMNRGEDLPDRMALEARFNLADKIGPAARNDPTVNQCLALIGMGQQTPIDGLCLAVRVLSRFNDQLISLAGSAQPVNGRIEMVFEDSALCNKMVHEAVAKDAEIDRLREEISILRNLARVRVPDGFRGGE